MRIRRLTVVFTGIVVALAGCAQSAVTAAPAPTPVPTRAAARTPGAQGFGGGTRVSGSVQSVDNGKITVTNATVSKVSGNELTVTWDGGGATVKLAPDAKLTKIVALSLSDVKPGSLVTAIEGSGGVAQAISLQ